MTKSTKMKIAAVIAAIFILVLLVRGFIYYYRNPPAINSETIIVVDENGEKIRIDDYKGKYVLLSYFQTWCGDCIRELEHIDALQKKVGRDKIKILMVSDEDWYKIIRFKEKYCNSLDYYQSPLSLRSQGIHIFPTTYLLNKQGEVMFVAMERYDWDSADILNRIN